MLMESSTIADVIVNSLALSFIMNIDNMLFRDMVFSDTKAMLQKCEDYVLYNPADLTSMTDEEVLQAYGDHCQKTSFWKLFTATVPVKLFFTLFLTIVFV